MDSLDKIGKSAEQLDYERDQAQLASESIFEAKLTPNNRLERNLITLGLLTIAAILVSIGLPSMVMATDTKASIALVQRVMVAGIGLIFWTGAFVLIRVAYRKWKGQ